MELTRSITVSAEKKFDTWVSAQSKAEYLSVLETLTCMAIPAPAKLLTRKIKGAQAAPLSKFRLLAHSGEISATIIDFYAFGNRLFPIDRLSLDALMGSEWRHTSVAPWIPRLQQYVHSVEAEMDDLIVVEGYFRVNETGKALMVTSLMRYCNELPDGERYKVVNSFFSVFSRVCRRSIARA